VKNISSAITALCCNSLIEGIGLGLLICGVSNGKSLLGATIISASPWILVPALGGALISLFVVIHKYNNEVHASLSATGKPICLLITMMSLLILCKFWIIIILPLGYIASVMLKINKDLSALTFISPLL